MCVCVCTSTVDCVYISKWSGWSAVWWRAATVHLFLVGADTILFTPLALANHISLHTHTHGCRPRQTAMHEYFPRVVSLMPRSDSSSSFKCAYLVKDGTRRGDVSFKRSVAVPPASWNPPPVRKHDRLDRFRVVLWHAHLYTLDVLGSAQIYLGWDEDISTLHDRHYNSLCKIILSKAHNLFAVALSCWKSEDLMFYEAEDSLVYNELLMHDFLRVCIPLWSIILLPWLLKKEDPCKGRRFKINPKPACAHVCVSACLSMRVWDPPGSGSVQIQPSEGGLGGLQGGMMGKSGSTLSFTHTPGCY